MDYHSSDDDIMSEDQWYQDYVKEHAKVIELENKVGNLEADRGLAMGCFDMIKECLSALGVDMMACPPMMYPEAIRNAVTNAVLRDREERTQVPLYATMEKKRAALGKARRKWKEERDNYLTAESQLSMALEDFYYFSGVVEATKAMKKEKVQ